MLIENVYPLEVAAPIINDGRVLWLSKEAEKDKVKFGFVGVINIYPILTTRGEFPIV